MLYALSLSHTGEESLEKYSKLKGGPQREPLRLLWRHRHGNGQKQFQGVKGIYIANLEY